MREINFHVVPMIKEQTKNFGSICDLGAGIFRFFKFYDCPLKIGIELIQTYVDHREYKNCYAICDDVSNFETHLNNLNLDRVGIISLIDFIEHLEKDAALDIIRRAMGRADRVIVFTPLGFDNQSGTDSYDFAKGGFQKEFCEEQKKLAIEAQRHKSGWDVEDFESLGFDVIVNSHYHGNNDGAIWAQWERDGGAGPQGPYK